MTNHTSNQNEMIFTMGLPAAGKTTVFASRFADTHEIIDSDRIMETHPDYDPENPAALHAWASELAEGAFLAALSAGAGRYLIDSTGTNAERMARKMVQAKARGFHVRLVYVRCRLETSLRRNAARTRKVPEYVIRAKSLDIATSFELVAPYADSVTLVDND
jgi:predicted ABC-type ATPase